MTPKESSSRSTRKAAAEKLAFKSQTVEERIDIGKARQLEARWAKNEKRIDASLKEMKKNLATLEAKSAARKKRIQPDK